MFVLNFGPQLGARCLEAFYEAHPKVASKLTEVETHQCTLERPDLGTFFCIFLLVHFLSNFPTWDFLFFWNMQVGQVWKTCFLGHILERSDFCQMVFFGKNIWANPSHFFWPQKSVTDTEVCTARATLANKKDPPCSRGSGTTRRAAIRCSQATRAPAWTKRAPLVLPLWLKATRVLI